MKQLLFAILALTLAGCASMPRQNQPASQQVTLPDGTTLQQRTSDNPGPTRVTTRERYDPKTGAVTIRETDVQTGASQFFTMPDFGGENNLMLIGAGIILLGIVCLFFPLTAPFAWWVAGGGLLLILLGSWLKSPFAPWVTGGVIVLGLGYVAYRNRKALMGVVRGVENQKTAGGKVTDSIDKTTTEADDRVIADLRK
jgi:hypothetical protein